MSQLPISINKKIYNIHCPDTERKAVLQLADYVNDKIALVAPNCKAMSEVALLSMTLLAVADDVVQCRTEIEELKKNVHIQDSNAQDVSVSESVIEDKAFQSVVEMIKNLTQSLKDDMSHS